MNAPVHASLRAGERPADALERMRALVGALRSAECYFHPANDIKLLETHISYVLLVGPFAYKLKKPVKLHFLDFSTLQARRHYCEEEARLNMLIAPELYLGVVPIVGTLEHPIMGGTGEAIEYALRMRRFPEESRLERLAASDRLSPAHVDALAAEIARMHEQARRVGNGLEYGTPEEVLRCALDNFRSIQMLEDGDGRAAIPRALHDWTLAEHARIKDLLRERRGSGFVRECHGDLHLGNVVLMDSRPVLFDRIEFNAGFRWIDVMNDLAFAVMDLHVHGYPDLGARLLNRYLDLTHDYGGLAVLRFYMAYRAMVRAKIACIRSHQPGIAETDKGRVRETFAAYVGLATRISEMSAPGIVLLHGVSGSGKTTLADVLAQRLGAVRVRSDLVRRRLHGYEPTERTHSRLAEGLYDEAANERTYEALAAQAREVVRAGFVAIVDAASLRFADRRRFRELAAAERAPFALVECTAPEAVLRARVEHRRRQGDDASEAGVEVLEWQLAHHEPLQAAEREGAIACDTTGGPGAADETAELLARRLDARRG